MWSISNIVPKFLPGQPADGTRTPTNDNTATRTDTPTMRNTATAMGGNTGTARHSHIDRDADKEELDDSEWEIVNRTSPHKVADILKSWYGDEHVDQDDDSEIEIEDEIGFNNRTSDDRGSLKSIDSLYVVPKGYRLTRNVITLKSSLFHREDFEPKPTLSELHIPLGEYYRYEDLSDCPFAKTINFGSDRMIIFKTVTDHTDVFEIPLNYDGSRDPVTVADWKEFSQ